MPLTSRRTLGPMEPPFPGGHGQGFQGFSFLLETGRRRDQTRADLRVGSWVAFLRSQLFWSITCREAGPLLLGLELRPLCLPGTPLTGPRMPWACGAQPQIFPSKVSSLAGWQGLNTSLSMLQPLLTSPSSSGYLCVFHHTTQNPLPGEQTQSRAKAQKQPLIPPLPLGLVQQP